MYNHAKDFVTKSKGEATAIGKTEGTLVLTHMVVPEDRKKGTWIPLWYAVRTIGTTEPLYFDSIRLKPDGLR